MGSTQAHRPLDDPDLALRVCHGSSCVFDTLPMVPAAGALTLVASVSSGGPEPLKVQSRQPTAAVNRQMTPMPKPCAQGRFDV